MRWNQILSHPEYIARMKELEQLEKDREFCCHNSSHLLDVSRLTYLFALEEGYLISNQMENTFYTKEPAYTKDIIYAIGFLHDIGKGEQYKHGVPHEEAGSEIAIGILMDCGYNEEEIDFIKEAILAHRRKTSTMGEFHEMLYRADKMSRKCYECVAVEKCNWPAEQKNMQIKV